MRRAGLPTLTTAMSEHNVAVARERCEAFVRNHLAVSRHRRGMVTREVVEAFRSIGWGWGGSWAGSTKDYMHFSATGH